MPAELASTARTSLKRRRDRGSHELAVVRAILDEGLLCHVAFILDGAPAVVPMAYARRGDQLYLHGASGNRTLRALAAGAEACLVVTLLDGLVLARSAFHHSMNYRSVVLYGRPSPVEDEEEMRAAATALLEHMAPGRGADARPPSDAELRATLLLRLPITEGSAKVRTGPPVDDEEDLALHVWAGVVPFALLAGAPVPDEALAPDVAQPVYVHHYPPRPGRA